MNAHHLGDVPRTHKFRTDALPPLNHSHWGGGFLFTWKSIKSFVDNLTGQNAGKRHEHIKQSIECSYNLATSTGHRVFANMFCITNCMQICAHGKKSQWNTDTLCNSKCTASLCSIACIRSNNDSQITNTLWWESVSLIKNIVRQCQGIGLSRKPCLRRDACTISAPRSTGTQTNGDAIVGRGARKLCVALSSQYSDRLGWKPAPDQVWLRG